MTWSTLFSETIKLMIIFPFWLGALPHLNVLILRSNRFHGAIGSWHTNFRFPKLPIIDLSYNEFTGNLPSEYFKNLDAMKIPDVDQYSHTQEKVVQLPIYTHIGSMTPDGAMRWCIIISLIT